MCGRLSLSSVLMVCRYCYRKRLMPWCTTPPDIKSTGPADSLSFSVADGQTMPLRWLALPLSQSILFPARGGLEGTAGSQAKGHWQGPNARSYHVYSDPETGIPTLHVQPSMFVYSHRSSYQCLACMVLCIVRTNHDTLSSMNIPNKSMTNVLGTSNEQLFLLWHVMNCRMNNIMTQTVTIIVMIWLY